MILLSIPALAEDPLEGTGTAIVPAGYVNEKDPWIDRAHAGVFNAVWRSAMRMDQWFGSTESEAAYMETSAVTIRPSRSRASRSADTRRRSRIPASRL